MAARRKCGVAWVWGIVALTAVLFGAPHAARAQAPPWLVWAPPAECPGVEYVEAKVVEGLGWPVPADVDLRARAEVVQLGDEWEVRVELQSGQGTGERRVRVRSCAEAADFVALAVTLAIDSDSAPARTEDTALLTDEPAPPLLAEEATARSEEGVPARPGLPFRLGVQLGALASFGAMPTAAFGFEPAAVFALGPWQARVAFRWYRALDFTVPDAAGVVSYEVLGGALSLGYRARFASLLLIPSLTGEVGQLAGEGGTQLWVRLDGALEAALVSTAPFEPFLSLGLSVPVGEVHFSYYGVPRPAPVAGVAALGVRAFFLGP